MNIFKATFMSTFAQSGEECDWLYKVGFELGQGMGIK